MSKFNVGQVYSCRSACDHNCIWHYRVVKRSDASVWLQELNNWGENRGKVIRKKIDTYKGEEQCYPSGKYSMAPVLGADDKCLLDSPEKIALQKEYSAVQDELREYHEMVNEIKYAFDGEARQVRLASLADEYGIKILERRKDKLQAKLKAA